MSRMMRTVIVGLFLLALLPGCKVGDSNLNQPSSTTGSNGTTANAAPPTVTSTTPLNGATGFPVNRSISVIFSKTMNAATLNATTFTLSGPSSAVTGSVFPSGATAVFTPLADLASNTTYTATVTTGATDLQGNPLAANYVWSFSTGVGSAAAPDTTPPTVVSSAPVRNAADVAINSAVTAAFSEEINPATISQTTFFVTGPSGTVSGAITPGSASASIRPGANLASAATYTATLTTGISDLSGNALAADYVWSFSTSTTADTTGPQWLKCSPYNGSTDNPVNTAYALCFDELIDPTSVNASTFRFLEGTYPGTSVSGNLFVTANCVTFKPSNSLHYSTYYFVDSPPGITDLAGNPTTTFQSTFWTAPSATSDAHPSVTQVRPEPNETGASLGPIHAVFSEPIYPPSVNNATFLVTGPSGTVNGTIVMSGRIDAVFIPTLPLSRNATYTATLTPFIKDLTGNTLSTYSWSFTTTNTGQILRTPGYETASGLAQDAAGNIYTAGTTTGTFPGSTGSGNGYVAKYNSSRVLQWIRQFGAAVSVSVAGIAVEKTTGDVFVTGSTPATLDSQTYAGGTADPYLMKFDTNGNWQWTRLRGTSTIDYATAVAVDSAGNAYMTGYTYGGFDSYTNQGSSDMFLVKYNAAGTEQWMRQRGTTGSDQANGVTTFDNGLGTIFVYVVGTTTGSLDGITPPGGGDVALVAYDSNGNWQWTQLHGSSAADIGTAVTVDGSGSIYYAGHTFGTFEPGYSYVGSYADGIVSKCTSTGDIIWRRQIGADQQEIMTGIAVDVAGNVYAAGSTAGNLYSTELLMPLNTAPNSDVLLVKYNAAGTLQWGRQPGTWWWESASGVVVDPAGPIYVSGSTDGDLIEMTSQNIHSLFYRALDYDAFLMSFDASGNKQ